MPGFERLSAALQYQVVHGLGFSGLRPVQELTIDAVLDGKNCVVLAPTAGGKTEAAFFPLLSAMNDGDWRPVSVLYLSPIRALLNNQQQRVERLAGLIGRRAFTWHGDTGPGPRRRFSADPADILLTTPESLEAMMMSPSVPARRLFAGLRSVIIDEVHAFAADDRGAHLGALLERLSRYCGEHVQRIGLSATVGNPDAIGRWLQGSSTRDSVIVSPPRPTHEPRLSLDYVASAANAAMMIKHLHPGKKRLVFVDSRRGVEEIGNLLGGLGVLTHVIHGSLSAAQRKDAERAFEEGSDCVIAATSALELGIDVGDLDHVLQLDSPPSVASFLQRMGRTGRRPTSTANCTFLCTKEAQALQAAAIVRLFRRGFVEDVEPSRAASHILAHQIMALCIAHDGVPRDEWWAWLRGATPFADIGERARAEVVAHMLAETILRDDGGRLWLGERGERLYGRRNFAELYAVFSTPRVITVRWGSQEIGTLDAQFVQSLFDEPGKAAFTLAGRAWAIEHVDWPRAVCVVSPTDHARATRWSGGPRHLGFALCQAMREVLVDDAVDPAWSSRMRDVIASLRAEHAFLREDPSPLLPGAKDELTWWTYAGGRANLLLAKLLEAELGGAITARNESLTLKGEAAASEVRVRRTLDALADGDRPTDADTVRFAPLAARSRLSKFEACLPEAQLTALQVRESVDGRGAREALRQHGLMRGLPRDS